jgi:Protein of unknown function (DUF1549)/Protein of unknown function (DUF1553)
MHRFLATLLLVGLVPVQGALAAPAAAKPTATQVAAEVDRSLAAEVFHDKTQLAPRSDDATFLRRVWLDLLGDIPTSDQVTAFLLDPAADKRQRVVRELLADPQFGLNWGRYWYDVIQYRRFDDRSKKLPDSLVVMLTDELNHDKPWNEIATQFVTATGDVNANGATAIILAQQGRTEEIAAETSRIFLGIQIQCAQCHDHPFDRWKREQFHEWAAFFPRVGLRPVSTPTSRSLIVSQNDRPDPDKKPPLKQELIRGTPEHYMPDLDDPSARGTRMQPKFFLTGAELPVGTPDAERRAQVAQWMTDSPWFAKAYVNRIWEELVGEGFYEPVDDLGPDRTPSAPQTIELLSRRFVESGYDVKWLFRTICTTEAYQRQCRPRRTSSDTPFTANVAQPLRSDQLYNAVLTALVIDEVDPAQKQSANRRSLHSAASARNVFEAAFGYDPSDPRDSISGSIPQALTMMNLQQLNRAIARPDGNGLLVKLLSGTPDDESVVEELYLRTLSREPAKDEIDKALAYRKHAANRQMAFEDLLWALLNSAEFSHRR